MRVIVGYECSGVVAAAFRAKGHEAYSCDIQPYRGAEPAGSRWHIRGDIWDIVRSREWDLGIFHPECTYLTVSAAWAFMDGPYHQKVKPGTLVGAARRAARDAALDNFRRLLALPFPKAIENPATSYVNKAIRRPDQIVQPYQFGHDASKATGLWLDGLPSLQLSVAKYVMPRFVAGKPRWSNQTDSGQNRLSPSDDRAHLRSITYPGIAAAMAEQWGGAYGW